MKLNEWEKEIKKLEMWEIEEKINSIGHLMKWKAFEKEYEWTGLNTLKVLLNAEVRIRNT